MRHIGRKSRFSIPHAFDPQLGGPRRNIATAFGTKKTGCRTAGLPDGENSLRIHNRRTERERNQTLEQTDIA